MQYTEAMMERVSDIFKVLAEPMRLTILEALKKGEKTPSELIKITGAQQANVSKHLSIMRKAGIVAAHRKGTNVYYAFKDKRFFTLCDNVCDYLSRRHEEEQALFMKEE